jgi:hypothetical protein
VAHSYNPIYYRGRDLADQESSPARQKVREILSQLVKVGSVVICTCCPSYTKGINNKIMVQANRTKTQDPF